MPNDECASKQPKQMNGNGSGKGGKNQGKAGKAGKAGAWHRDEAESEAS